MHDNEHDLVLASGDKENCHPAQLEGISHIGF